MSDGLHLVGGVGQETDHQVYDPGTDSWQAQAPLPIGVRAAVAAVVADKLYIIGGVGSTAGITDAVQIYDPATNMWSAGASMPTARLVATGGALNGKVYVAGGEPLTAVLEAYDPATDTWETVTPMPAPRTYVGGGVLANQFLCVFGGGPDAGTPMPDTYCYSPAANIWTVGATMLTPRTTMATVALGGSIYAIGGRTSLNVNVATVERLDP
jgi:N-acetylneuraminic acid mutarotase